MSGVDLGGRSETGPTQETDRVRREGGPEGIVREGRTSGVLVPVEESLQEGLGEPIAPERGVGIGSLLSTKTNRISSQLVHTKSS